MEVLLGPSFTIQVASSSPYVRDRNGLPPPQDMLLPADGCSLVEEPPEDGVEATWSCFKSDFGRFGAGKGREEVDYRSDSSSSIGAPGDDSDDDSVSSTAGGDGEEVRCRLNSGLGTLGSLEESLPIKRGLSSHFTGKSKSFANLAEAKSVQDFEKPENSLNKRRRVLIASKLARRSSFYTWPNLKSMPLLALREEEDDDADADDEEELSQAPLSSEDNEDEEPKGKRVADFRPRRLLSFKSRSFSLADLQHHHDQHEEEQ